jgi:hypothetical protein
MEMQHPAAHWFNFIVGDDGRAASDLDELRGSGFGVGTRSKVIELRRSYTALKINPNQIARALHRKRARNVILGISARPT